MKRKDAINLIRAMAAKGDEHGALRIYIENRVSFAAYQEARQYGYAYRKAHPEEFATQKEIGK